MKLPAPASKPILETVPQSSLESFHCEVIQDRGYGARWHFHPEHQITLVLKSCGYRVVGDNISPLSAGDLVLVGANLPHVWHQDEKRDDSPDAVHSIVVRFRQDFLGDAFLQIPEVDLVRQLLLRASRGFEIQGAARGKVSELMQQLAEASGFGRLLALLSILETLSRSSELQPIASASFSPELQDADQDRMQRVMRHIHQNLEQNIERDDVARCAGLSPGAFSRFFKTRTGKTLPQYVNELRIGRACSLLSDPGAKVADIALDCGFDNLANFNRQFRAVTHMAPRQYRLRFTEAGSL